MHTPSQGEHTHYAHSTPINTPESHVHALVGVGWYKYLGRRDQALRSPLRATFWEHGGVSVAWVTNPRQEA